MFKTALSVFLLSTLATANDLAFRRTVNESDSCPGYTLSNVQTDTGSLLANLELAGPACNAYGPDLQKLVLSVTYESEDRLHVKIVDANSKRYEVPDVVFQRPDVSDYADDKTANIKFSYTKSPFTFNVYRASTGEVLFDSSAAPLVFETQFLRLKTKLPSNANIYGLGEHTNSFRLDPTNTTRTFWNRDAYGVPTGTNLYGTHPIYFEQRTTGTHGVLLMNSNGLDVVLADGSLEYRAIGGVFDLYFFAGSTPVSVAQQYAKLIGTPAEVPYWGLGFHQCKYGYTDYVQVSQVITNYSLANIPLETMWTDIDYMYSRWTFTNDPQYFPTDKMQEIVHYLHDHNQRYVLMIDPAVAYQPNQNYTAFDEGVAYDAFMKFPNGSLFQGVVWPGPAVFPDWFHPNATLYWTTQLKRFFDPQSGIDVDGLWIDMNEASNFCPFPCTDPAAFAKQNGDPPPRTTNPPAPGTPIFTKRSLGYNNSDETPDPLNPPYAIHNAAGALSENTIRTDLIHANGLLDYNTHNLYGFLMSMASQQGMAERRPGLRTMVITRSTFVGAGRKVGKWLGDNLSDWDHYRVSIAGQLGMASIYQIPMVGSDICGFGDNTTETLCARWATLGAFSPFMRNHNSLGNIPQEFYVWNTTAEAARKAIGIRYQLLDYIYTAFHRQSVDGTPILAPLWFYYPEDTNTYPIDLQFFYGDHILVSPVTQENSTSVDIYLPNDIFYDFHTFAPVQGSGANVSLTNVGFTDIPLHIRGGAVLPLRSSSAMTTTELRKKDFQIAVAPATNGTASGALYIDDGESLTQDKTTEVSFTYKDGCLSADGHFDYDVGSVKVAQVVFLGQSSAPNKVTVVGGSGTSSFSYNATAQTVTADVNISLNRSKGGFSVTLQ